MLKAFCPLFSENNGQWTKHNNRKRTTNPKVTIRVPGPLVSSAPKIWGVFWNGYNPKDTRFENHDHFGKHFRNLPLAAFFFSKNILYEIGQNCIKYYAKNILSIIFRK